MSIERTQTPLAGPGPLAPESWAAQAALRAPELPNERIRLEKGGAIVLETDGFRIIESRGLKRSTQQAYESITHVAATERALLVGTDSGLTIIRSADFPDPATGPASAREALLERLDGRLEGRETLRRIDRLEAFSANPPRPYAIWAVALLCLLATVAQMRDAMLEPFAAFIPALFTRGEFWRAVTGQFLHGAPGFPIHLAMNVGGLWVLGYLVERPLGTVRTIVVLAMGGLGTILGSLYAGYDEVIGSSGLVFGLAGAMLALELHYPEALPAYWRMPRRLFIGALILQFGVIDQLVPFLAGEAHLGGFIGGYAAAWAVGRSRLDGTEPGPLTRAAALGTLVVTGAAVAMSIPLVLHDMASLERHALRLLNSPMVPSATAVQHDNAVAWFIATEGEPTATGLDLAVALADRAVLATARQNPNILDTLAEALFQAGDRLGALLTIDEAIQLAPGVRYFEEQRRRFTGERPADDRPAQPGSPEASAPESEEDEQAPEDSFPLEEAPGITL